jgi:hypothetical protein
MQALETQMQEMIVAAVVFSPWAAWLLLEAGYELSGRRLP